jgi:hypothetical protein
MADLVTGLIDFKEIEWGGMHCTDLAQVRGRRIALVNKVMNLQVP